MTAFAGILPQRYFIEQIAKDRGAVQVMVKPGASPATCEPKPRQMVALSRAENLRRQADAFRTAME